MLWCRSPLSTTYPAGLKALRQYVQISLGSDTPTWLLRLLILRDYRHGPTTAANSDSTQVLSSMALVPHLPKLQNPIKHRVYDATKRRYRIISRLVRQLANRHLHHIQGLNDWIFWSCVRPSRLNWTLSILLSNFALSIRSRKTACTP